ncbi:hypothetical protein RvVAR0630_pl03640 (plasmid) [Agrobacterium vitis]|uniref:hypothetical protein n=1 Tax=Agrobacterium vitis TaxID=373 RepID=UPI0015D6CEA2|nr:hypothetical protein [Agrobacterium vitis]BCH62222.1 hypothetical protein RvVAR0630_pl03640 [Agrobacterium vitis]
MKSLSKWVRLPSAWIEGGGLRDFVWEKEVGGDNIAALMALMAIAHHADAETGESHVTYDVLCKATAGDELEIVDRASNGRSTYQLRNYDREGGWAMLLAKRLYAGGRVASLTEFRLRSVTELNALKLYFLFVARRGRDTNMANISFPKIHEYTGVDPAKIKAATSLLASSSLAYIERIPSRTNDMGVSNAYRLVGLEAYQHMGTRGRGQDANDFYWLSDT